RSYAPLNPPEIITFSCADAASGLTSSAPPTTIALSALLHPSHDTSCALSGSFLDPGAAVRRRYFFFAG
ncbi:MAG TPA: hypothetical protein VMT02_02785, partial [Burkholderiales bacterium]|nr:hypothetical protein [Burkholderiales bacterium]